MMPQWKFVKGICKSYFWTMYKNMEDKHMSVTGVKNGSTAYYQGSIPEKATGQECFMPIGNEPDGFGENMEEKSRVPGEVSDIFAGMSFEELLNSGRCRKIPVVNQIVTSRNPEDGQLYRAFFTDKSIECHYGDGRRAWEIEIEDAQQAEKVKEYFGQFKPDRDLVKEYYSGDKMKMAVVQRFWLDLFESR